MSESQQSEERTGLYPGAHFPDDFVRRLEHFLPRMRAVRERREGAGSARLFGAGEEFVGFRPYRPGEDLRQLDWKPSRTARPAVRQGYAPRSLRALGDSRRRVRSMAVGPPGKFQRAAEIACALATLAVREGATARVRVSARTAADPPLEFRARRRADLSELRAFFEGVRAGGAAPFESLTSGEREAGRVSASATSWTSRPLSCRAWCARARGVGAPTLRTDRALAARARRNDLGESIEWSDPETGRAVSMVLDQKTLKAYESELRKAIESLAGVCAKHRIRHGTWSTERSFEDICSEALSH